jgi:hypothetical protein
MAALALTLTLAFASSAAARAAVVHIVPASGGGVTVSGYAPRRETLNVIFDADRCAATFQAESRRTVSSFGDKVRRNYSYTFGPGNYQANVAMYVCVYMRTLSPLHPKTVATAFAPLG